MAKNKNNKYAPNSKNQTEFSEEVVSKNAKQSAQIAPSEGASRSKR